MKCEICRKKTQVGMNVSHSNRRTKRKFKPNVQKVTVFYKGKIQKMRLCAKCRKRFL